MSKYIVRCIFNGTGINLAISAKSAGVALQRAQKCRQGRKASAYVVYERRSGNFVAVGVNR